MMNMIAMIGWLTGYIVYFGTLHILAVILSNFRQKYVLWSYEYVYIMYMEIMHARMLKVKYETYAYVHRAYSCMMTSKN